MLNYLLGVAINLLGTLISVRIIVILTTRSSYKIANRSLLSLNLGSIGLIRPYKL